MADAQQEEQAVKAVFRIEAFADDRGRSIACRTNIMTGTVVYVGSATVGMRGSSPSGEPISFTYNAEFEIEANTPQQAFQRLDGVAKAAEPRMEQEAKLALSERLAAMQRPPGIQVAQPGQVPQAPPSIFER